MNWINVGNKIERDWYELRCKLDKGTHLKIYLDGLKNQDNHFYIDFGDVLFCKAIDESWDLNPSEILDNKMESIAKGVLVELTHSQLRDKLQQVYFKSFHHYQVIGINFGIDVISEKFPLIFKLEKRLLLSI